MKCFNCDAAAEVWCHALKYYRVPPLPLCSVHAKKHDQGSLTVIGEDSGIYLQVDQSKLSDEERTQLKDLFIIAVK